MYTASKIGKDIQYAFNKYLWSEKQLRNKNTSRLQRNIP